MSHIEVLNDVLLSFVDEQGADKALASILASPMFRDRSHLFLEKLDEDTYRTLNRLIRIEIDFDRGVGVGGPYYCPVVRVYGFEAIEEAKELYPFIGLLQNNDYYLAQNPRWITDYNKAKELINTAIIKNKFIIIPS